MLRSRQRSPICRAKLYISFSSRPLMSHEIWKFRKYGALVRAIQRRSSGDKTSRILSETFEASTSLIPCRLDLSFTKGDQPRRKIRVGAQASRNTEVNCGLATDACGARSAGVTPLYSRYADQASWPPAKGSAPDGPRGKPPPTLPANEAEPDAGATPGSGPRVSST